jgi:L-ascorbate metabolism protein UlaG (beta-lactamase superfamily)
VEFAGEHELQIRHVILTHLHADFIAGHLELRDRAGASIYLGAAAKAGYAFTPLDDGDTLEFGGVRLKALETPGTRRSQFACWCTTSVRATPSRMPCSPEILCSSAT